MIITTRCHACARPFEIEADGVESDDEIYIMPAPMRATCPHCGREHSAGFEMSISAETEKA